MGLVLSDPIRCRLHRSQLCGCITIVGVQNCLKKPVWEIAIADLFLKAIGLGFPFSTFCVMLLGCFLFRLIVFHSCMNSSAVRTRHVSRALLAHLRAWY